MSLILVPWPADGDPAKRDAYLVPLAAAGATAVLVAPGERVPDHDGLCLVGGGDVEPARFGQSPDPRTSGVDVERDALELSLVQRALKAGMPILAICRGMQLLNVALGGDLIQHVEGHRGVLHLVRAAGPLAWADGSPVNSSHHQAIGRLGAGLTIVARAPDNVVEAVVLDNQPFAIGVQWHPEREPRQPRLFQELIAACHASSA